MSKPLTAMLDTEAASPLKALLPSLVVLLHLENPFNMGEISLAFCVFVSLPMKLL